MFLHSRAFKRGNFHSTRISRFFAKPVPVPLSRSLLNAFFYVVHSYPSITGASSHARIAPLSLFDSMLSGTPGSVKTLSFNVPWPWPACSLKQSADSQTFEFLGAMGQIQSTHSSPRRTTDELHQFRAVGSALPGKAS